MDLIIGCSRKKYVVGAQSLQLSIFYLRSRKPARSTHRSVCMQVSLTLPGLAQPGKQRSITSRNLNRAHCIKDLKVEVKKAASMKTIHRDSVLTEADTKCISFTTSIGNALSKM